MTTATHLTPMGRIIDAISRAYTLLVAHTEEPPVTLVITTTGRVDVLVSAVHTFDETVRRGAVDTFRTAAHLPTPEVVGSQYTTQNDRWKISTDIKVHHCEHCGGVTS